MWNKSEVYPKIKIPNQLIQKYRYKKIYFFSQDTFEFIRKILNLYFLKNYPEKIKKIQKLG